LSTVADAGGGADASEGVVRAREDPVTRATAEKSNRVADLCMTFP
jgi:hypothetical protein